MIKVAMIGAGSIVFSKNLTGDILQYPEFRDATFAYMDIDKERLEVGASLCRKAAKALGAHPTIIATQDRREALKGADFVINMVQIGGMDSTLVDFEIPRKYGLKFTIADTTGPGGLFRALRTYPMIKGMCQDMMDLCPNAWLLNYSNPMSMNMQTIYRTSNIKGVGLCHSVQGTFDQLMRYIKEDPAKCEFLCAGINHMAFYLKMRRDGKDLYPRLWEALSTDQSVYNSNKVRFELMKMLGYFVTESSEHNAEYNPYFIAKGDKVISQYGVPIDEYLRRCDGIIDEFRRLSATAKDDNPLEVHKSHEYGSTIIHSIVTGTPSVVYGNLPNNGAISNLPPTAIVETPTLVDRGGCQLTRIGELPPGIVAYITPHIQQHELFIRAAMEGRRDYVYQAAMFDPHTASVLTLDQIKEMCDEMIAAHGDLLPKFDSPKSLVPTSGKQFGYVDPKVLHASWDAAQAKKSEGSIKTWQVIGPFKGPQEKTTLEFKTAVDEAFLKSKDGSVDLSATYEADGKTVKWKKAEASKRGFVNLGTEVGEVEWAVAYGYVEIESIHARETVIRCGSDDCIRIWVNGKQVHSFEGGRGFQADQDSANIHLKAGINKIFVKIVNYKSGWGFGATVPPANF